MTSEKKICVIPGCYSTNYSSGKLMLSVPNNEQRRKEWLRAANIKLQVSRKSKLYVCEDHFELPKDAVDWQRFCKGDVKRLFLNPQVVPHENLMSPLKNRVPGSQLSDSGKKRRSDRYDPWNLISDSAKKRRIDRGDVPMNLDGTVTGRMEQSHLNNRVPGSQLTDSGKKRRSDRNDPCLMSDSAKKRRIDTGDVPMNLDGMVTPNLHPKDPAPSAYERKPHRRKQLLKLLEDVDDPNLAELDISFARSLPSSPVPTADLELTVVDEPPPVDSLRHHHSNQADMEIQPEPIPSSSSRVPELRPPVLSVNVKKRTRKIAATPHSPVARARFQREGSEDTTVSLSSQSVSTLQEEPSCDTVFTEHITLSNAENNMALSTADPRFYLGVPKEENRLVNLCSQELGISPRDIIIVLRKIRLNDPNVRLGYDFGLTPRAVGKIFQKTVPRLATLLKQFIFWPPQSTVQKLMPISFRHRFMKVISIIDCFEIQIQKPSNPKKQALSWSEYKHCNTVKILISSTPLGFINFVSKAYGGRISDKTIVMKSGFTDHLPSGSDVLADRGFKQVEGALARKNVKLIRPASVKASVKPTKAEVRASKRVASIRIHIERVISRIREFKFLAAHSRINNKLIPIIDDCVVIAAALVNLQQPIIKK